MSGHPLFRAQAWVILVQVFFMFLALWGVAVAAARWSPGLIWTGFVVLALWQVFELLPRALTGWTLMHAWAPEYTAATDPAVRQALEGRFLTILGIIEASAGIRRQLWGLGHLLFGLAFVRRPGLERVLGVLFLFNAARLILRALGEATGMEALVGSVSGRGPFILGMVPLFALLAVWLWRREPENP